MLEDKNLRDPIDRRLSGLQADGARRARIRAAVQQERRANLPMKRKLSPVLICLLALLLAAASVALAEHLNLFHFFGRHDQRYARVAEEATLATAEPVETDTGSLGRIDSAYYDGLTLNLALSVTQLPRYEAYTPSAQELAAMTEALPQPVAIPGAQVAGAAVLTAYNQAVQSGTPYGFRAYTVYPSDHTLTDDGIDLPPASAYVDYGEDGTYYEMRSFALPLPQAVEARETLNLSIQLYQSVQTVYFDGEKCYMGTQRSDAGALTATVPHASGATLKMTGTGQLGGAACTVEAEVSPMAAMLTLRCEAPLETLLSPPETAEDAWIEIMAMDEQQRVYRPECAYSPQGQTEFAFTLQGVGELPETLTLYAFYTQEGPSAGLPDAAEGIVLYPVP